MGDTPWENGGTTTTTTTTEPGSSSPPASSSGSSTPAAPPEPKLDTYISDTFRTDAVKRQKEQTFAQVYMQLWGEPATEEYLSKSVNAGLNVWEFTLQEKSKPAFMQTKTYKDSLSKWADLLRSLGVA